MKFVSHAHSILVAAVKHTDADQEVILAALALSRATLDVELNFIHVVDPQPSREGEAHPAPDLIADGSIFLDAIVAEALPLTPARVVGHLAIGNALPRILELAGDLDADLLIVGTHTHPRAALAWLWGSTSRRLVRLAPCAVLVAREKASHDNAAAIESPCPSCVDIRFATAGETHWCKAHAPRHVHGHLHYIVARGFGGGSMFIPSEGP